MTSSESSIEKPTCSEISNHKHEGKTYSTVTKYVIMRGDKMMNDMQLFPMHGEGGVKVFSHYGSALTYITRHKIKRCHVHEVHITWERYEDG